MPPVLRGDTVPVYAHDDQKVEIYWRLKDGSTFKTSHTCPPKPVIGAKNAADADVPR